MSLLDQLSSLCIQSSLPTSFFSLHSPSNSPPISQQRQNLHLSTQTKTHTQQKTQQSHHNSQQKVIKLFNDEQLKPTWRFAKTDKKMLSQQKFSIKKQENPSQFNTSIQKDNQSLLIILTKMAYLIKNKTRKINYQFFVKLEQYSKLILKEKQLNQKAQNQLKLAKAQSFCNKLSQTIKVISLKYFQSNNHNNKSYEDLKEAFDRIRQISYFSKKILIIIKNSKKVLFRDFYSSLQQYNRRAIKMDLFESLICSIFTKKFQQNRRTFFRSLCEFDSIRLSQNRNFIYPQFQSSIKRQQKNPYQNNYIQPYEFQSPKYVQLSLKFPLNFTLSKAMKLNIERQKGTNFYKQKQENIPLKLHSIKPHDQQINLNDCVDNGHLLMSQMKTNTNFKQQLENLTISNINSKTTNSSLNSSYLASQNFIPQLNNEQSSKNQEQFFTMRKSVNDQQNSKINATFTSSHPVKQPKKSLVITKRKQSLVEFNPYTNQLYSSERINCDYWNKKTKSTNVSSSKISSSKQALYNDKQIIKKMLQQLNDKFACENKNIQITLSSKKPTSTKKNEVNFTTSSKKGDRKKINSQLIPTSDFPSKQKANDKEKQKKSSIKDQIYQKNECSDKFKSVKLQESKFKKSRDEMKISVNKSSCVNRMKQSKSQLSKKNPLQLSQGSQDSEICKLLSKYRTKKPAVPQRIQFSGLKDDSKLQNNVSKTPRNDVSYKNGWRRNENVYRDQRFYKDCSINNLEQNLYLNESNSSGIPQHQFIDDSFYEKKPFVPQLCYGTDNNVDQSVSYLPFEQVSIQNEEQNNYTHYTSQKPFNYQDSTRSTNYFQTGSKNRISKQNLIDISIQNKRSSFDQNKQDWDQMFQKQKKKFNKNQQQPQMQKKKSILNEEVISEIKNKIQKCFILSQKDQNAPKEFLSQNRSKKDSFFGQDKNTIFKQSTQTLSQQSSKKNSLSKLYTTLSKLRRQQS